MSHYVTYVSHNVTRGRNVSCELHQHTCQKQHELSSSVTVGMAQNGSFFEDTLLNLLK